MIDKKVAQFRSVNLILVLYKINILVNRVIRLLGNVLIILVFLKKTNKNKSKKKGIKKSKKNSTKNNKSMKKNKIKIKNKIVVMLIKVIMI